MGNQQIELSRAHWRTSSYSGSNGQCVQVAFVGNQVAVRDSKYPERNVVVFSADAWRSFSSALPGLRA